VSKLTEALSGLQPGRLSEIARNARLDGWENDVTGFGTARDKTTYTVFGGYQILQPQQASSLYHGDDLAARIVDIVPDEMLREGFDVDVGDPTENAEIADALEALGARQKLGNAIRWGRLYGGGGLLIGADDGRSAAAPLIPERANALQYLYEVDRRYLWPCTWYAEPGHPKLCQPETYFVSPTGQYAAANIIVHETRLLLFGGATTGILEREVNAGWDHSILQRVVDVIRAFNTGFKAVEVMLTDGNQAVFKLQGLAAMIGAQGEDLLRARLQAMDMVRSVLRALVLDAGDPETGNGAEDIQRLAVSFEQIPATIDRFMLRLASAAKVPATVLWGQSPAGMNATGESDYRWFFNGIRAAQNLELAPRIRRLVTVMRKTKALSSSAAKQTIKVKFPPLWSEAPSVEATRRKANADADVEYIEKGVVTPEEVALSRFGQGGEYGDTVVLTPEGLKRRQDAIAGKGDQKAPSTQLAPTDVAKVVTVNEARAAQGLGPLMLETGTEDPDGGLTVAEFTERGGAPEAVIPKASSFGQRADARDTASLIDHFSAGGRYVIAGGPRTGKSTLAVRAGERHALEVRHADSLVQSHDWGDDSREVSRWFDAPGAWIVEGVSTPRALRKWLKANPEKTLDATVIYLRDPIQVRSKGQTAMANGVATVWREVVPELRKRGVTIIERDA
jgi:hypothetical protein